MAGTATKAGRTKAHRVRVEHGIGLDGPVGDLLQLAAALRVDVIVAEALADDLAGAYLPREPRPVIVLNGADIAPRLRFTLAHEIGHHVFRDARRQDTHAGIVQPGHWIEVRANAFAAELLIPAPAVAGTVFRGMETVVELANAFGTSLIASAIRLVTAGIVDARTCDALKAEIESDDGLLYAQLEYRDSLDVVRTSLPWSSVPNSRLVRLHRTAAAAEELV